MIQKKRIDLVASSEEFLSIDDFPTCVDLLLSDSFTAINGIGTELFNDLVPYLSKLKVSFLEKRLRIRLTKGERWLDDLEAVVNLVHTRYLTSGATRTR